MGSIATRWAVFVVAVAVFGVASVCSPAALGAVDHIHVADMPDYVCLGMTYQKGVTFHDIYNSPVPYTGQLTISVSHPMGYSQWSHDDHYWDPNTQTVKSLSRSRQKGASVAAMGQGPAAAINLGVNGASTQPFGVAVHSFGEATVTANAGGKTDSKTIESSAEWARGRATRYSDTSELPEGCEGPYIVAIP